MPRSPQVATELLDYVEEPARLLFSENYDRLVDVKTKYDLKNQFYRNRNVEPRTAGD